MVTLGLSLPPQATRTAETIVPSATPQTHRRIDPTLDADIVLNYRDVKSESDARLQAWIPRDIIDEGTQEGCREFGLF